MTDENAKELAEREAKAFSAKQNLDSLCQEIALNFYPQRADFTSEPTLGEEFAADLYDSEPVRCRRDLANARASMLRPRGQEWYSVETPDEDLNERPDIEKVLDKMNSVSRTKIYEPSAGFVRAEKEADHDIVTFGNAIKTVESEVNRLGKRELIIRNWHFRDCAWFDDMTGTRPDVMFRRMKLSARHIEKKFKDAKLHESITRALEKEPDKLFDLCHVMMPADEYDWYKQPKGRKRAPFASVYYDSEHRMLLRETPSDRFRYVVDRWETLSGSQYGYSPAAWTALPDGRAMQTMALVLLEAGEKSLDPPMKATHGAVTGEIRLGAGGITWVDKEYDEKMGPAIEPLLPPNRNVPIGIDLINRATLAMRDSWFLTKLTLPQQAKTAYETSQLVEEYIRANIPLFEPWEAGIAMILEEIFGVLFEMNAFGPLSEWPPELADGAYNFAFANPLQDAIKKARVFQAQQVLGIVAGAQQADPTAGANHAINLVKIVQDATRATGAPSDWVHDEDAANAAVAGQAQGQNILSALNVAGQAADVVNTGADAAQKLQQVAAQPAVDKSFAYGPT